MMFRLKKIYSLNIEFSMRFTKCDLKYTLTELR